jgi:hypothetical protein
VPQVRGTVLALVIAVVTATLSACAAFPAGPGDAGTAPPTAPTIEPDEPETPRYTTDLSRVCADGLGFPGLPAYDRTSNEIHPAVLMEKRKDDWTTSIVSDRDFPNGWMIEYSDSVNKAQLVICYERTGAKSSGKTCAMKDDKTNEPFTMTLYNTTYLLRVVEARTGKTVYKRSGRAASTRCPTLTFVVPGEDRTKSYTDAQPTDYRKFIKRYIAP